MRIGKLFLVLATSFLLPEPELWTWSPESCKTATPAMLTRAYKTDVTQSFTALEERYRETVIRSPEGSPIYSPKPFPERETDILEDAIYALEKYFARGKKNEHARVAEGLRSGRISVSIDRVENWRIHRCRPDRPRSHSFLLRLFEKRGEIGRIVVHDNGMVGRYVLFEESSAVSSTAREFPAPGELERALERLGAGTLLRDPRDAQLVTLDGVNACVVVRPCLAFREGAQDYLLVEGTFLFELGNDTKSIENHRLEVAARGTVLGKLGKPVVSGERLQVSVGLGWRSAFPVGPRD